MFAALPKEVREMIDYREWSIKKKEGIAKFTELKGKVLPTICIAGEPVFQSIIPQYEELIDELKTRAPLWKQEDTPAGTRWVGAPGSERG